MNYSKITLKKRNNKKFRNIIISWMIFLAIGILIGTGFSKNGQADAVEPYGMIDVKTFNCDLSKDWTSGAELGFIPLEIGLDEELQEFIYCLSYGYNIDYAFVMGLIQTESTFNPGTISSTNDYGLMQINQVNHSWLKEKLNITDFLDPYQNIKSGIYILRSLFEKYEDPAKVLMAYNHGENGAKKLWNKGIYETDYTNKVFNNIENFNNYLDERNESHE